MAELDASWEGWLIENVQRHCSPESMVDAMIHAGINPEVARQKVAQAHAMFMASPVDPLAHTRSNPFSATNKPASADHSGDDPIAPGNRIDAGDRIVKVTLRCKRPYLIIFDNVLSAEECNELIEHSRKKLKRSTTVNPVTGAHEVIDRRTSEGTFFNRCENTFITAIDKRVARLINWPLENGEGLQILHYGFGGEYRPHFDYFPSHDPGGAKHMEMGGQRVSTLVVFLNDVESGGDTIFPELGLSITPHRGSAVYFHYCNALGHVDPLTLHGGAPVLAGEKWIMTKWMRQRPYG